MNIQKKTAFPSPQLYYDLVISLLGIEIEIIVATSKQENQEIGRKKNRSGLQWTDQLSDLVEIAYAIVAKKCLNDGNALLKNVVIELGNTFNVDLSNYTHIFYAIRNRKGERAVFLKSLHDALNAKMDDMDK